MSGERGDEELERRLRGALGAVDPGAGFAPRVLARIAAEPRSAGRPARAGAVVGWLSFGLAASVILAVLLAHQWQVQRLEHGREARRQLIEALRMTDEKLNLASRVVNGEEHGAPQENPGV